MYRSINGRNILSREARSYKEFVAMRHGGHEPLSGPVAVTMLVFRPARRGDLDGRIKVILDCCEGILYGNDSQVVELHAYRYEDKIFPRVELTVEEAK
jgi:Holliday junction resolvase RusA-like endonuclease